MQKTVFLLAFFSSVSLVAMENKTAADKNDNPCTAWLRLVRATAYFDKAKPEQAEMARAVEMAQRAQCKPVYGVLARKHADFYRFAGAQVSCPEYWRNLVLVPGLLTVGVGSTLNLTCTFTKKFNEENKTA